MPKKAPITLNTAVIPNPPYTSAQDAVASNIDILVRLIKKGEEIRLSQSTHAQHSTLTPDPSL